MSMMREAILSSGSLCILRLSIAGFENSIAANEYDRMWIRAWCSTELGSRNTQIAISITLGDLLALSAFLLSKFDNAVAIFHFDEEGLELRIAKLTGEHLECKVSVTGIDEQRFECSKRVTEGEINTFREQLDAIISALGGQA